MAGDDDGCARRGELCALQWDLLDLDEALLVIRTSIAQNGGKSWEKATKTHQQRRIVLDDAAVGLLRGYRQQCESDAASVGVELVPDGRIFSPDLDHATWQKPNTISQRYRRMCASLGWDMHLHQLRHYSATELIGAGVDVRTVAGRLGHGWGRLDNPPRLLSVTLGGRPEGRWRPEPPHAATTRSRSHSVVDGHSPTPDHGREPLPADRRGPPRRDQLRRTRTGRPSSDCHRAHGALRRLCRNGEPRDR